MERLNKYLAHAGIGSRRHCDELIAAGRVKIDGRIVRDLGVKVDIEKNKISVDDNNVRSEKPTYWVVNKPVGYLCTNHDPAGRPLALDLITHVEQRVYTVGRLDEASEGLLLMTNDGELAFQLMHPKFEIEKTYLALVAGQPSIMDLQKLLDGVWLSDGKVKAKAARKVRSQGDSTWVRIVLCEGKNREIRRMLAQLGHKVMRLQRISLGPVRLDRLPKGKSRRLSLLELNALKKAVEESGKKIQRVRNRIAGTKTEPVEEAAPTPATVKPIVDTRPIMTSRPPASRTATPPRPAAPRPATSRPPAPRPSAPRPSAPRPAAPRPAAPRPTTSRPAAPRPPASRSPTRRPPEGR